MEWEDLFLVVNFETTVVRNPFLNLFGNPLRVFAVYPFNLNLNFDATRPFFLKISNVNTEQWTIYVA